MAYFEFWLCYICKQKDQGGRRKPRPWDFLNRVLENATMIVCKLAALFAAALDKLS